MDSILKSKIDSVFHNIQTLNPKDLGIRKKLDIYIDTNSKNEKTLILYITQKSRFLQKDADKIEEIYKIVCNYIDSLLLLKVIFIESPLCSKAKLKLEQEEWRVSV